MNAEPHDEEATARIVALAAAALLKRRIRMTVKAEDAVFDAFDAYHEAQALEAKAANVLTLALQEISEAKKRDLELARQKEMMAEDDNPF